MKAITDAIRNGADSFEDAIAISGFAHSTVYEWIAKGEDDLTDGKDTEFSQFVRACGRADAEVVGEAMAQAMELIRGGDGPTIRWFIDRKRPRKQNIELSSDPNAPLAVVFVNDWNGPMQEVCDGQGNQAKDEKVNGIIKVKVTDGTKDIA